MIYSHLRADCGQCFGLCCAALAFSASVDFPIDKEAGEPCPNLESNFYCRIHKHLRQQGFRGCTVYDCFGAGQAVAQTTYQGHDWRQSHTAARQMFQVFLVMRQLHELLWYLSQALTLQQTFSIHGELKAAIDKTRHLTQWNAQSLIKLDVAAYREEINALLLQTSELVRIQARRKKMIPTGRQKGFGRGVDLIGADLRKADMVGANLRGAYLIAADLRGASLSGADLIGADFRDTDIRGADLTESIFLTQTQINGARGDASTKLPAFLSYPTHWSPHKPERG